jgi:hypothetical protein
MAADSSRASMSFPCSTTPGNPAPTQTGAGAQRALLPTSLGLRGTSVCPWWPAAPEHVEFAQIWKALPKVVVARLFFVCILGRIRAGG